jgi:D-ribose pyranose/furanose isomerase RbsD
MEVEEPMTLEKIKERENEIRKDLDTMLETLEEKLRVNIMAHVTALLILGILEGRMTSNL